MIKNEELNKKILRENLTNVLQYYGINCEKTNIKCINPAHIDRTPSMGIDKTNTAHPRAHCFSCGCQYDSLDVIGIMENLTDLTQIIQKGNEILHIYTPIEEEKGEECNQELTQELITQANAQLLNSNNHATDKLYFYERGMSKNTIKGHKLGIITPTIYEMLNKILHKAPKPFYKYIITYNPNSNKFILTRDRTPELEQYPKYYKPAGQEDELYNSHIFDNSAQNNNAPCQIIFITEGCFDALSVEEVTNSAQAVALMGLNSNKLKQELNKLDKEQYIFVIALDNDTPGQATASELANFFSSNGYLYIDGITPQYKDYNEFLVKDRQGFQNFIENKIKEALNYYLNNSDNYLLKQQLKIEKSAIKDIDYLEQIFLLFIFTYGNEALEITYNNFFKTCYLKNEISKKLYKIFLMSFLTKGYLIYELFLNECESKNEQETQIYKTFWQYCENNSEKLLKFEDKKQEILQHIIDLIKQNAEFEIYNNMAKNIQKGINKKDISYIQQQIQDNATNIQKLKKVKQNFDIAGFLLQHLTKQDEITGLKFGCPDTENLFDGLKEGSLIAIAGRPAMGKTTYGLTLARNYVRFNTQPLVFFSLEMTQEEIYLKMFKQFKKEQYNKLRTMSREEIQQQVQDFADYIKSKPFILQQPETRYFEDLENSIIFYITQKNARVLIIDHLHLLTLHNCINRTMELSKITARLKEITLQYKVTIILLAQLNRSVESKESKRPTLNSLRDSGGIEENADIVCFVYREAYYLKDTPEFQKLSEKEQQLFLKQAELIIAKNRNGDTGCIYYTFQGEYSMFFEMGEYDKQNIIDTSDWTEKKKIRKDF